MRPRTPWLAATSALIVMSLTTIACGWFSEDDLDVTYDEDFGFTLPLNANALCPVGDDCSGASVETPVDRSLTPIEFDVQLDVVAATGRPKLAEFTSRFKSIEVTRIAYEMTGNSLTFDTPALNIYIGPTGAEEVDAAGVKLLGTIPSVAARTNAAGNATLNAENKAEISALIQSLRVAALVGGTPVIRQGQPFPPSGEGSLKITFFVRFVANPADAVR